jgi:ABC-type nickel/cobalt efflux system permease component RcnA
MAMTQTAVLAVGLLATIATIGMFVNFGDMASRALVTFTASLLWGTVAVTSFNVLLPGHRPEATTVTLTPVAYVAGALAGVLFMFAVWFVMKTLKDSVSDSDFGIET